MIEKPPGVKAIAREIQKPPYDESAVAPKVLPAAISLNHQYQHQYLYLSTIQSMADIPHPGTQLHQAPICICHTHDHIRLRDIPRPHVDTPQHKGSQREASQSQRRGITKRLFLDGTGPVQTRLEFRGQRGELRLGCLDEG